VVSCLLSLGWAVDFVVPVPLSIARLKERGYNQSTLLARPAALALGLPFRPQALARIRETASQVGLGVNDRRLNVKDAFLAASNLVHGCSVLVIDDVTTTGATIDACAAALKSAGAVKVYGFTLAQAPHPGV
jgi:Predicted amidophosphoribosyltransferases